MTQREQHNTPESPGARRKGSPPTRAPAATLPVVPDEKVLETRSRAIFEETMSPWPVTPWTAHDYGMDAMVEILRRRDDGGSGHLTTAKRIGVQLKASETDPTGSHAAVAVRVTTLRYWLSSEEPFMVVFCHVPSRRLVYRWVDDELVAELTSRDATWFTRQTVTLRLPLDQVLSSDRLDDIARESRRVVVRRHRVLAPGTYERLFVEARAAMDEIASAARNAGLDSVVVQLDDAAQSVRNAMYIVALAGPMRAGKSTLFNVLARREISPVARRPTTAVPVLATAGDADSASVMFFDGRRENIPATSVALAEYATQDGNDENHKGVRVVAVRLVSERLERGVAILDAPGLFDPSESIRAVTASALATAHAVLFVMDVSAARTGGFKVEHQVLDELKRAFTHSERVFLLLNKDDELAAPDREDVLATIGKALAREKLAERLAAPPIFISAKRAWDWVLSGGSESPIAELEAQIWDYLLKTNATGVVRLEASVQASLKAIDRALKLVALRRATSQDAATLHSKMATASATTDELRAFLRSTRARAMATVEMLLTYELGALPKKIGDELRVAGAVPSNAAISERMHACVENVLKDVWAASVRELEGHAREASTRLEAALDQVGLDHDAPEDATIVSPSLALPDVGWLAPEAVGFGVLATLFAIAVAPAYALAAGLISAIVGAIFGKKKQLRREIAQVERWVGSEVDKSLDSLSTDLKKLVASGYERLERHIADRWAVFEKDASHQLAKAGARLNDTQVAAIEELEAALDRTRVRLEGVAEEIRWTPNPR